MSKPRPPLPAKLVISVLLADKALFRGVLRQLQSDFGTIDLKSPWMDFGYTDYYYAEMGRPLFRRMLAFEDLIQQQALSRVKLATNAIEQAFAHGQRRQVNIDPGYLLLERFVLATGKNFSHRIYIGDAIYADLTLIYQKRRFSDIAVDISGLCCCGNAPFPFPGAQHVCPGLESDPGQARWRGRINEMAALTHETLNKRSDLC
jgi:hypothetical protein